MKTRHEGKGRGRQQGTFRFYGREVSLAKGRSGQILHLERKTEHA